MCNCSPLPLLGIQWMIWFLSLCFIKLLSAISAYGTFILRCNGLWSFCSPCTGCPAQPLSYAGDPKESCLDMVTAFPLQVSFNPRLKKKKILYQVAQSLRLHIFLNYLIKLSSVGSKLWVNFFKKSMHNGTSENWS